jgi:hypothetical protein
VSDDQRWTLEGGSNVKKTYPLQILEELLEAAHLVSGMVAGSTALARVATAGEEDLVAELLVDLGKDPLESGESTTERAWLKKQVDLGDLKTACFRLKERGRIEKHQE